MALLSVAQEEQQVSAAQQMRERQTQQVFRALLAHRQRQEASPRAARQVVSPQLVQQMSKGPAVSQQRVQEAQQEPLARQAWKE